MWEDKTYDAILADMLSRVPDDVDKREGSIIYDALAPCAYKLAETYYNLSGFIDLVSGDTAVGEYLDRVVNDYGITRKPAIAATRKIETNASVDIGTHWGIGGLIYAITAKLSDNVYSAICETAGAVGNTYTGALESIDNVVGIAATLTDIITSGEDEETDDNLRTRFYNQVQNPATSGNVAHYKQWALSVSGVGGAKVFPLWNGNGTVKVLIVDENMAIDTSLESAVATYIESQRPIGATVTVSSPSGLSIAVNSNIKLDGSQTLASVQTTFIASLTAYLKSEVFSVYNVSYAKIGSLLLATAGVSDYNTLLVNGGTANIVISDTQLPICGTVTLTEVS